MEQHFFNELMVILSCSLVAAVLFRRIRLPMIISHLLVGALIGPDLLGWVKDPGDFLFLAEFGVVFLLFSLGLEFSLPKLMALKHSVFGLGSVQVLVCTAVFFLSVNLWGSSPQAAFVIAAALALSSTAIVSKELANRQHIHLRYGQLSIGVLLFQDLVAVLFLILVPAMAGGGDSLWGDLGIATLKGIALFIALMSFGKWVLPRVYTEIGKTGSDEIFVLSTLVIILTASWVTHSVELSMALGGFVIGMMLGENHFKHQIEADIRPFKDVLLGLFFVSIGMQMKLSLLAEYWPRILLFALALIAIKAAVIALLARAMKESSSASLQTGLTLAQAGEFGFALIALARQHDLLPEDQASFIMLVAMVSMIASPLLINYCTEISQWLERFWSDKSSKEEKEHHNVTLPHAGHVIIGGFGRVGQMAARLLTNNDIPYIALDQDIDKVSKLRKQGLNVAFGNCNRVELLKTCHLESARLMILTFKSLEEAKATLAQIRKQGYTLPIIVRCQGNEDFTDLLSMGASHVVPELFEASLLISAQVLTHLGLERPLIDAELQREREMSYPHLSGH